ncbi:ArsC family reductase [Altererythrobacter confluentis]|uniref:ArsC family reductase n=2 Tax=Allopontixanthobacter confluentis TaxID=1849021 RepID=A0A6L7GFT9_9SPHN|nr:ArsC family reductase [Allopontixanthobacter confluentis]MXP14932.1 ArsC family reductase [Allopontixanthobacter confluentis]
MTKMTLYGIPGCDTMKKARVWLDAHGVEYAFHDYKKQGIDLARLQGWADKIGWEMLLNKRGTTFRKLDDADKADIDTAKAVKLMAANPSLIKRPVVEHTRGLIVGFDSDEWEKTLG